MNIIFFFVYIIFIIYKYIWGKYFDDIKDLIKIQLLLHLNRE